MGRPAAAGAIGLPFKRELLADTLRSEASRLESLATDAGSVGYALALPPVGDPTEPRDLAGALRLRFWLDAAATAVRLAHGQVDHPRARALGEYRLDLARVYLEGAVQPIDEADAALRAHPAVRSRLDAIWGSATGDLSCARVNVTRSLDEAMEVRERESAGESSARPAAPARRRRRPSP